MWKSPVLTIVLWVLKPLRNPWQPPPFKKVPLSPPTLPDAFYKCRICIYLYLVAECAQTEAEISACGGVTGNTPRSMGVTWLDMWLRADRDQSLAGVMAHWHDDSDLGQRPLIKLAWVLYHSLHPHQSAGCLAGLHHCIMLTIKHVCGSQCKRMEVGCSPADAHVNICAVPSMLRWQKARRGKATLEWVYRQVCVTVGVLFLDIDLILVFGWVVNNVPCSSGDYRPQNIKRSPY